MRPVESAPFIPLRAVNEAATFPTANVTICRVKDGTKTAFEWIRQHRHAILAATGLTLGLVSLAAAEALTYLPLTILMIGLGAIGMLRQHLAKKAFKEGDERLAKLEKNLTDFKARLPRANREIQTIEQIDAFANEIASESTNFQKGLKDNHAGDIKRFQKCLAPYTATVDHYKNRLRALRENPNQRNEFDWTINAYRDFAQRFLTKIQLEAQFSIDRESAWVKILRKRADRA
ncbi:MAG: hypothetical protein LLG04_09645 [Parachlamydia sp.]|nr:hypothetical protein [Parachlamydia sp.]